MEKIHDLLKDDFTEQLMRVAPFFQKNNKYYNRYLINTMSQFLRSLIQS